MSLEELVEDVFVMRRHFYTSRMVLVDDKWAMESTTYCGRVFVNDNSLVEAWKSDDRQGNCAQCQKVLKEQAPDCAQIHIRKNPLGYAHLPHPMSSTPLSSKESLCRED